MKIRNIGIMGGSFDPIHLGHLLVASEVMNAYNLDQVIFVPSGNPPHKNGLNVGAFHRLLMVNMAVLSNDKFSVSDFEINNAEKSYTLNTLKEFHKLYKNAKFYFITGADAVVNLDTWHQPAEILKLCTFIAVTRPGTSLESVKDKIKEIKSKFAGDIQLLEAPMFQISSSNLRYRFKNGVSAKYLLPESVEQYIIKNDLYK